MTGVQTCALPISIEAVEKAGGKVEVIEVVAAADKHKAKHRVAQNVRKADKEAKQAAAKK